MSRTLIYQTNKEFDKCTELLRNILSVQESRQDSKSPTIRKINRKKQSQSSTINIRTKKSNNKITVNKSPFIKTNINNGIELGEGRSSYSPNKFLHSTIEEPSLSKNRLSPNKTRKYIAHSPSPINNNSRQKTSPSSSHRHIPNKEEEEEELVRSSSCGDLPSSKSNHIRNQFLTYLKRIQTISKQIRIRYSNSESYHLWNELEKSLSSALSYANYNKQIQLSLTPLHNEIIELRKQLKTTNIHLHEYDLSHRNNDQYVDLQKKFDTNQIQYTQLLLDNQQLKTKCYLLQDKLDHLERNNTRLIQRITEQDLYSISKRTEWISTDNCYLLREEIIFLRKKLYHIYDDLSILLNRNQTFENSIREQKQQLNHLKSSAQQLLHDLDNRLIEEKIKRFLNNILFDQYQNKILKNSFHKTSTSSIVFETPQKSVQTRTNILNDSNALSKLQNNRNSIIDTSTSTIDDADSTITSSSSKSLTILPINIDKTKKYEQNYLSESGPELDQISNLTSKMFSSGDEEDINISTSSSSKILSDAEKLMHM